MKFSKKWLEEWVCSKLDTEQLVHELTMAGLEVDSTEPVAGLFERVVVGQVQEIAAHPNAEKLSVCAVDVGEGRALTIVTADQSIEVGQKVPTALVGAKLANGMSIELTSIRDVESYGMFCSEVELGMSEAASNVLRLPPEVPVGHGICEVLMLDDESISIELTPNRGDCLSIRGLAREVGVIKSCRIKEVPVREIVPSISDTCHVNILAQKGCGRYTARIIRGINPRASTPLWAQEKLRRSGIKCISPVVDATNLVMIELGQPMHAFDLDKITGAIDVRMAAANETLTLLDGQTAELTTNTLVIADETGPIAIAGVMGGLLTSVTPETENVFLESAYFSPVAIAGKARHYGLQTDSSYRFERGVDPDVGRTACDRVTALLLEWVGGQAGPIIGIDAPKSLPKRKTISLRLSKINAILGLEVEFERVSEILTRLGFELDAKAKGEWLVTVPSHRFDVEYEEDLIEEVARIYGYDAIPEAPITSTMRLESAQDTKVSPTAYRSVLVARGYHEAITYSFVEPFLQHLLEPKQKPIALSNPISAEMSVMRTSLWTGLIKVVQSNLNRQQKRVRVFETGLRFIQDGAKIRQEPVLAGALLGSARIEHWSHSERDVDFYDAKADVEALLSLSGVPGCDFDIVHGNHTALHPGQTARIQREGQCVGYMGRLHPAVQKRLDITQAVYLFELDLGQVSPFRIEKYTELSKHPSIRRDIAVVVDQAVPAVTLQEVCREAAGSLLQKAIIFDVYQGEGIPDGKKSLALGFILQHTSRTLVDTEVNDVIDKIVKKLEELFDASLRS